MKRPAGWARTLLELIVPATRLDDVLGDLHETGGGTRDAVITAGAFLYCRVRARWWAVVRWMTFSDLRFALRLIRKEPVLSATAVAALAAAIAVTCMGYTFADQMVSATLPFPRGDRFVRFDLQAPPRANEPNAGEIVRTLRARATTLEHVGALALATGDLTLRLPSGEVDGVHAVYVTPDTLRYLPYTPLTGRLFVASDGAPAAAPVVLLRESLWERDFGRAADIIGRTIDLDGTTRTVVGVMPNRFEFPVAADVWLPLDDAAPGGEMNSAVAGARLFGILRDGVAREAAQAEVQTLMPQSTIERRAGESIRVRVLPFTATGGDTDLLFPVVLALILLTLLVVGGNGAVLMTARGAARATELAVRAALGGGRARIIGQLTAEVLVLGVGAAVIGVGAAVVALRWIDRAYAEIPFWIDLTPGVSTFAFLTDAAFVITALAGVWPAAAVTRGDLAPALQHAGRSGSSGSFGRTAGAMITVQIALAVGLLTGAVSMARGFLAYVDGPADVPQRQILSARVNLPRGSAYDTLAAAVERAARTLPGVSETGIATDVPRSDPAMQPITIETMAGESITTLGRAPGVAADSGFLAAIDAHAMTGRIFSEADSRPGALPVALVNESFVREYFGGSSPLGRRILVADPRRATTPAWREIVGVVPDRGLTTGDPSAGAGFYVPFTSRDEFMLVLRASGSPERLTQPLRAAIALVNPAIRLREIMPLEQVGRDEQTFLAGLASAMVLLGAAALALSIVSVYALLSFAVARRTREIGVRMALGATSRRIVLGVVGFAAAYLALGAVIGTALGALLMQARGLLVFRVPAGGAWVGPAVILPLLVSGLIACWVPARRAVAIEPAAALKAD